jgi:hypothetical protein
MRRAQRIVQLQSEVVLRSLEWLDALEAFHGAERGEALATSTAALENAEDRLQQLVIRLRTELEHLTGVPA